MHRSHVLVAVTLLVLLLAGCAPAAAPVATPAASPAAPAVSAPQPVAPVAPQTSEWDMVVEAAKKEGQVTFYSVNIPLSVRPALTRAFKEKYGIKLEVVGPMSAAELVPKIETEQRAKAYVVDVVETGGSTPFNILKPRGLLAEPIKGVPEAKDLTVWNHDPYSGDPEGYVFIYYNYTPGPLINTKLVSPEREPKSYLDLLDPWWKGKIIWDDPSTFGPGSNAFTTILLTLGEDYLRKLAATQDVKVSRVRAEIHELLVRGEYAIVLGPSTPYILKLLEAGAPVKVVKIKEGTAGAGWSVMIIKNAPHPNAARLFINWFISKEGQYVFSYAGKVPAYRKDVSQDHIHPYYRLTPDYKQIPITKDFLDTWAKAVELAADIFKTRR